MKWKPLVRRKPLGSRSNIRRVIQLVTAKKVKMVKGEIYTLKGGSDATSNPSVSREV